MSRFLKFTEVAGLPEKKKYSVRSKTDNTILGNIGWYAPWNRYCFYPAAQTVFDSKCLSDINAFIQKIK